MGSMPPHCGKPSGWVAENADSGEAVADLASETDLPLGVVRVLLGDLRERGLVRVVMAASRSAPEESVLRSVLDGLRAL